MGGGNICGRPLLGRQRGLSPRGRGKLLCYVPTAVRPRSIPAWAGETNRAGRHRYILKVYPRVGGGNLRLRSPKWRSPGLSPRGRGKPPGGGRRAMVSGSIPAWAGETAYHLRRGKYNAVYPRVGGGNSSQSRMESITRGLSPRGRGKPLHRGRGGISSRSIPAWAGETDTGGRNCSTGAVYPRVGGGNAGDDMPDKAIGGLSPRGRGKLIDRPAVEFRPGSIPAWAGETPQCCIGRI